MTYEDRETSYDSAFERLTRDAFPDAGSGRFLGLFGPSSAEIATRAFDSGEQTIHEQSPNMGAFIEARLGDDLAALQADYDCHAPGTPERARYEELVSFVTENLPNVREDSPDELLSTYRRIASPETYVAIVLTQAGVEQSQLESFLERLSEEDAVRDRIIGLVNGMDTNPSLGGGNFETLSAQIDANSPLFQAIAADPDSFFQIANSEAFDGIISHVSSHLERDGTLDQQGMVSLVASISLQDKASLFMQIGGATAEEVADFQNTLNEALELNPELEGIIDTAITNTILSGNEGGNAFETLANAADTFVLFSNTDAARSLLTDRGLINNIVAQAGEEGTSLTLSELQDIGIENTVYNEAGRFMALNHGRMDPAVMMLMGSGIDIMAEQAKNMGDMASSDFLQQLITNFQGILTGDGLGGVIGGIGNSPGFLSEAGALTMSRFGASNDADFNQQVFAAVDSAFIFDGSDPDYPAIDYSRIARNHANNTWDTDGNVRPDAPESIPTGDGISPT